MSATARSRRGPRERRQRSMGSLAVSIPSKRPTAQGDGAAAWLMASARERADDARGTKEREVSRLGIEPEIELRQQRRAED